MTGEAAVIARALRAHKSGRDFISRCPAHKDSSPSFTFRDNGKGGVLVHCWAGCQFVAIRDALRDLGVWPERPGWRGGPVSEEARARRALDDRLEAAREAMDLEARRGDAAAIWRNTSPLAPGSLQERYLTRRLGKCLPWPPTMRAGFWRSAGGRSWPALISAACRWPDRHPVAVQITPLAEPGVKAWSKPNRLTRGVMREAAVRLAPWEPGRVIVICEGVEDGLAILAMAMANGLPWVPWAILGVDNAQTVALPAAAEVVLMLDGDKAGFLGAFKAARVIQERGHVVRMVDLPRGTDALDSLTKNGEEQR